MGVLLAIKIYLGRVGSGKTATAVRDMALNLNNRNTYSNIITKNIKNQITITSKMIIKKEIEDHKKNKKTGELEPVYRFTLNKEFWKNIKEPINVTLDEAHSILNARRSMSKVNIVITDWLALIRRVLGESEQGMGDLIMITQLPNRIDIIARDMASNINYHICHYTKGCWDCSTTWTENSEMPEPLWNCPECYSNNIKKFGHTIEVYSFGSMKDYEFWRDFSQETYYKHYLINDIEDYFPCYDTMQWESMFSDLY